MRNCSELWNSTQTNGGGEPLQSPDDIAYYSLTIFMFASTVYALVVLVTYVALNGFEDSGKRNRQFTVTVYMRKKMPLDENANRRRQLYRTLMFSICILVTVCLAVQFCLQQFVIFQATGGSEEVFQTTIKYIYALQIVFGYLFMWVRQRLFYFGSSPLRNLLRQKKLLTTISSLSFFFVWANIIVQLTLVWYWNVCTALEEALTWLGLCALVQGPLIALFIYPLWTINRESKRFLKSTDGRSFQTRSVGNLIRRCLVITSIYFITDLTITLVMIVHEGNKESTSFSPLLMILLQNFNSMTNIACMLCSFRNWKTILVPWRKIKAMRRMTTRERHTDESGEVYNIS